jgi:hypothetical protein
MSVQAFRPAPPAGSPILAAIGICLTVALGAVLGTTDTATLAAFFSGKWLTQSLTDTQQSHTVAIAALEQGFGHIARELDFVATRVGAAVERSADRTADRLATLDTKIAELNSKIAALQGARPGAPAAPEASDVIGLRSSLHELASAHSSAVAALTKRLDRIEVKVGLASDVPSAVPRAAHKGRRTAARAKRPAAALPAVETDAAAPAPRPERGHLFDAKPLSQQDGPLRLSNLGG